MSRKVNRVSHGDIITYDHIMAKMTVTHLVFALMTTAYILVAIQFEERDLLEAYGKVYADYRQRVPMFIPFLANKKGKQEIE